MFASTSWQSDSSCVRRPAEGCARENRGEDRDRQGAACMMKTTQSVVFSAQHVLIF